MGCQLLDRTLKRWVAAHVETSVTGTHTWTVAAIGEESAAKVEAFTRDSFLFLGPT